MRLSSIDMKHMNDQEKQQQLGTVLKIIAIPSMYTRFQTCQSALLEFSHLIYGYFYSYFTDEVMEV